jgi:putative ABC transport system substrate-binding protein
VKDIAMRRREFITLLGGAAAAWPRAARAQQINRVRRIGMLMGLAANDAEALAGVAAFQRGLRELGWLEGSNLQIEYRYAAGAVDATNAAAELVAFRPEVIVARSTPMVAALLRATRTVPIVFTVVGEPIASNFVASYSHPGGTVTGFTNFEHSISDKWLEILKEIVPTVRRVGVLFNPDTVGLGGTSFLRPLKAAASALAVELMESPVDDPAQIEQVIAPLANGPNNGLIVLPDVFTTGHRKLIVALAAQLKLPAVYPYRYFVTDGGLISYGTNAADLHRQAASYVDRILKGEKPADLPVQAPTRYETVLNMKTARGLGLTVSDLLLVRADEVIE